MGTGSHILVAAVVCGLCFFSTTASEAEEPKSKESEAEEPKSKESEREARELHGPYGGDMIGGDMIDGDMIGSGMMGGGMLGGGVMIGDMMGGYDKKMSGYNHQMGSSHGGIGDFLGQIGGGNMGGFFNQIGSSNGQLSASSDQISNLMSTIGSGNNHIFGGGHNAYQSAPSGRRVKVVHIVMIPFISLVGIVKEYNINPTPHVGHCSQETTSSPVTHTPMPCVAPTTTTTTTTTTPTTTTTTTTPTTTTTMPTTTTTTTPTTTTTTTTPTTTTTTTPTTTTTTTTPTTTPAPCITTTPTTTTTTTTKPRICSTTPKPTPRICTTPSPTTPKMCNQPTCTTKPTPKYCAPATTRLPVTTPPTTTSTCGNGDKPPCVPCMPKWLESQKHSLFDSNPNQGYLKRLKKFLMLYKVCPILFGGRDSMPPSGDAPTEITIQIGKKQYDVPAKSILLPSLAYMPYPQYVDQLKKSKVSDYKSAAFSHLQKLMNCKRCKREYPPPLLNLEGPPALHDPQPVNP